MKIAVIGGGSSYTPELVYGLLKEKSLQGEVALYDIDKSRLEIVGGYCKALKEGIGSSLKISLCQSLEEALYGASFIVTQIRVGGNETRARDEEFVRYLGLVAQETTGAVGFLKAYRTIPEMLKIAENIKKYSPKATVINFTNPAGIISSVLYTYGGIRKTIGLCNVPIYVRKTIESIFKEYWEIEKYALYLEWGGLNHLTWIFDVQINGKSVINKLISILTSHSFDSSKYFFMDKDYIKRIKAIPSPYLRYYTNPQDVIREQELGEVRGRKVQEIEKNLFKEYREKALNGFKEGETVEVYKELSQRGGADYSRMAVDLIKDLANNNSTDTHILNVPDTHEFFRKKDMFVEVNVEFREDGIVLRYPKTSPHPEVLELISQVDAYERATVCAGIEQSLSLAKKALLLHPLVWGKENVEKIIDYMKKEP